MVFLWSSYVCVLYSLIFLYDVMVVYSVLMVVDGVVLLLYGVGCPARLGLHVRLSEPCKRTCN